MRTEHSFAQSHFPRQLVFTSIVASTVAIMAALGACSQNPKDITGSINPTSQNEHVGFFFNKNYTDRDQKTINSNSFNRFEW